MGLQASAYLYPSAYFLDGTKYIPYSVIFFVYVSTSYHIKINTHTHPAKKKNPVLFLETVII